MQTFVEFVAEAKKPTEGFSNEGKAMGHADLVKHIGATRAKALVNHPWYKQHVASSGYDVAYRHRVDKLGNHHVEAYPYFKELHKTPAGIKPPKQLQFQFYKHRVTNAHLFKQVSKPEETESKWEYKSSHKNED